MSAKRRPPHLARTAQPSLPMHRPSIKMDTTNRLNLFFSDMAQRFAIMVPDYFLTLASPPACARGSSAKWCAVHCSRECPDFVKGAMPRWGFHVCAQIVLIVRLPQIGEHKISVRDSCLEIHSRYPWPIVVPIAASQMATGTRHVMRTLKPNLSIGHHDTFWVLDKREYSVDRVIIARVVTLCNLCKPARL